MEKRTEIIAVLDKSSSMRRHILDVVTGLNGFIEQQRTVLGDANFTLVQFNANVRMSNVSYNIKDVAKLDAIDFSPCGQTALYDAIGTTIERTADRLSRQLTYDFVPTGVIICIMTDGEENASQHFKLAEVAQMIRHRINVYGWQFYFFAATKAALLEGKKLGINNDCIMSHEDSSDGYQLAYKEMDRITTQYRIEYKREGGVKDATIEL